jgi:hypothetical protein
MFRTLLLAATSVAAMATAAEAQTIVALVGNDQLVHIDAATQRGARTVRITGMPAAIAGIDVRPADGLLYAVSVDGTIATVDPQTGVATVKSKIETMVPMGQRVTVDFNPMADRLRVIGSDGTNLRVNVDNGQVMTDGRLRFQEGSRQARIVAGAYTNSVRGPSSTTLYDIDASGLFIRQAPPNDGVLVAIGEMGVSGDDIAFDIQTSGETNTGWVVAGGALHRLDLQTGRPTKVGDLSGVQGTVRDIAVLAR